MIIISIQTLEKKVSSVMDENASKIEQSCSKGIWVGKSSRNDTQQTKWNTIENITRGLTRQKNKCQGHRTSWRNPNQWVWHIHIDTDTLTHSRVCMCLYCVFGGVWWSYPFMSFRHGGGNSFPLLTACKLIPCCLSPRQQHNSKQTLHKTPPDPS